MKLLIVTAVEEYKKIVLDLFKKAQIDNFSGSEIEGFKNQSSFLMTSSWFPSDKGGVESIMFFSFTEEEKIRVFFDLIKAYNSNLTTNNPIKAVVLPIEKSI